MSNTHPHQTDLLGGVGAGDEDGESWLMSYLDVLTLLITLFVLLLALSGNGDNGQNQQTAANSSPSDATALESMPSSTGVRPEHDGVLPKFDGVTVTRSAQGLNLRIQDHLLFDSAQATLTEPGQEVLQEIVPLLHRVTGEISIEGHSDSIPIATYRYPSNWELSSARASAVLRFLEQQEVSTQRMRAIGYADTRPLGSNDDETGRATNRRVELVLHDAH